MAKQQARSYSANTALIQGEGAMRQAGGFQDYSKAFEAPMQALQQAAQQREAREQARNAKVESYLQALNANIDVTALTPNDQKVVNEYLMGVKDEYAEAANAIAGLKPGTPEYMEQLDIMNGVKNSLANLKGQLDGYQESKANYYDSYKDQSAGNNSLQADNAAGVFTGEMPFSIGTGGNLFFRGQDGTNMAYKDVKMPFKKDYKTAIQYNDLFTPIYNSGTYDSTKQKMFEDKIRAMMSANPDGMKSIIADKLSSFGDYEDLIPLLDDPANLGKVTDMFVQRSSEAARNAAANGKAAKNLSNPSVTNLGPDGGEFSRSYLKTGFVGGIEQDIYIGRDGKRYYRKANDNEAKWQTSPISGSSASTPSASSQNNTPMGSFDGTPQNLDTGEKLESPTTAQTMTIMKAYPKEKDETDGEYQKRIFYLYSQAMTNGENDPSGLYQKLK